MPGDLSPDIDSGVADVLRIDDYLAGGTANFAVDRVVAQHAFAGYPGGLDGARHAVRAHRSFRRRAVAHLAMQAGARQFLDLAPGIPVGATTNDVARALAPGARVVTVDHDPMVLAHAHRFVGAGQRGTADFVPADLHDPAAVLSRVATALDLARPVAVLLVGALQRVPGDADAEAIVAGIAGGLAPGSWVVLSHVTGDVGALAGPAAELGRAAHGTLVLRSRRQVERLLTGLEPVPPGLVPVDEWHPPTGRSPAAGFPATPAYAAVGRVP